MVPFFQYAYCAYVRKTQTILFVLLHGEVARQHNSLNDLIETSLLGCQTWKPLSVGNSNDIENTYWRVCVCVFEVINAQTLTNQMMFLHQN